MAIQEQKKQSDLEKRLQILRRQVYGKQEFRVPASQQGGQSSEFRIETTADSSSDIIYLHKDLLKILLFSSIAIGAQILLFFLLQNHFLNINF